MASGDRRGAREALGLALIPEIHRATHAIGLALAANPDLDVTQAEAHVLAHLHESGDARISELHTRFGHRRSTLTSVLDRLEQRALVRRTTDPGDRRSFVVTLTRAGRGAAAAVHRALAAIEEEAFASLAPRERERLAEAIRTMTAAATAAATAFEKER